MRWRSRSSSSTGSSSSIGNGGVGGLREPLGVADRQLDLARRDVRVDLALLAADDLARDADHVLGAQLLGQRVRVGAVSGWKTSWRMPAAVAQVDEDQAAVVAPAVHPARDADALADARGVELAGPGVAVARSRAAASQRPPRM